MFAIVEVGGKQYNATLNQRIQVDNLNHEVGQKIILDKILCLKDEKGINLGSPLVKGATVEVEIIRNYKDDKVLIFKKRRRKNSRRKRGHRQQKTEFKVLSIQAN
ncbi:MAG: 50S ribosomal protein L21 [Rickettsiales bacterium]|nr:50S ribosomal protein L21 [Rickettsiales bacterium]